MSGWEYGWGLDFLVFMNHFGGRTLDVVLEPFHWIGGELGYSLILPLLFWCINDRMGRRLYILVMLNSLVNGVVKIAFARPRPYQVDPDRIVPAHVESSYGIPSGHAQGGTVLGLFFAVRSRRKWVKILLIAAIVAMGLSRMIIGVHFLQDVLLGWTLGLLVFLLFIKLEGPVVRALKNRPARFLVLPAALPCLIAIGADGLAPAAYPVTKSLLATGGAMTGILLGLALERRSGAFSSDGRLLFRLLRAPIGLGLLFGVQMGLSMAFHAVFDGRLPTFGISAVYALRYIVVGFCGAWLIPEIFIRLRLAAARLPKP